jgi:hypothetical protein
MILLEPSHTKWGCGRRSCSSTSIIQWPNAARISSETPQRWVRNISHQVRGFGFSSVLLRHAQGCVWWSHVDASASCPRVCDLRSFDVPHRLLLRKFILCDRQMDFMRPAASGGQVILLVCVVVWALTDQSNSLTDSFLVLERREYKRCADKSNVRLYCCFFLAWRLQRNCYVSISVLPACRLLMGYRILAFSTLLLSLLNFQNRHRGLDECHFLVGR